MANHIIIKLQFQRPSRNNPVFLLACTLWNL